MRRTLSLLLTIALAGAVGGCGEDREDISSAEYLLSRQHQAWRNARETLKTDSPNMQQLYALHQLLCRRTPRIIEKKYAGDDREAVLAKIRAIADRYEAEIAAKLTLTPREVVLAPGASLDDIRRVFEELDKDYRELEAMTSPEE